MPIFISRVDVTPGVSASWEDIDITAHVGDDSGNIAAAFVEVAPSAGGDWGLRNNGSTDDRVRTSGGASPGPIMGWVSVDSGNIFEANLEATDALILLGYATTAEGERFINLSDILHSIDDAWTDIDITSETVGVATFAALELNADNLGFPLFGLRRNGSTDDFTADLGRNSHHLVSAALDSNEIFECWDGDAASGDRALYLMTVLTDNFTAKSNGDDQSTGSTGSYVDTDVSPDVADSTIGIYIMSYSTNDQQFDLGIRRNSAINDNLGSAAAQIIWHISIEIDDDDIFEQQITDTRQDLFLLGEFNATPAPPEPASANLPIFGQLIFNSADEENRPSYGQRIARGTDE